MVQLFSAKSTFCNQRQITSNHNNKRKVIKRLMKCVLWCGKQQTSIEFFQGFCQPLSDLPVVFASKGQDVKYFSFRTILHTFFRLLTLFSAQNISLVLYSTFTPFSSTHNTCINRKCSKIDHIITSRLIPWWQNVVPFNFFKPSVNRSKYKLRYQSRSALYRVKRIIATS